MKGKVSLKTIVVLVILVLVGVLGFFGVNTVRTYMSGASADTEPKNVLATSGDDGKSATVIWSSDKATMGVVEYGTTPASLLLRSLESESVVSHKVLLSPLKPNTSYYFRIRVGEEIFDNNGIPYSFKTKNQSSSESTIAPMVSIVPTSTISSGETSGCNRTTDYNGDKVINSLDYIDCLKSKNSSNTTGTMTGTGPCKSGVDYDKNGVINSIDRIKCLQDNKQ